MTVGGPVLVVLRLQAAPSSLYHAWVEPRAPTIHLFPLLIPSDKGDLFARRRMSSINRLNLRSACFVCVFALLDHCEAFLLSVPRCAANAAVAELFSDDALAKVDAGLGESAATIYGVCAGAARHPKSQAFPKRRICHVRSPVAGAAKTCRSFCR